MGVWVWVYQFGLEAVITGQNRVGSWNHASTRISSSPPPSPFMSSKTSESEFKSVFRRFGSDNNITSFTLTSLTPSYVLSY